jgi:hypothetical protein
MRKAGVASSEDGGEGVDLGIEERDGGVGRRIVVACDKKPTQVGPGRVFLDILELVLDLAQGVIYFDLSLPIRTSLHDTSLLSLEELLEALDVSRTVEGGREIDETDFGRERRDGEGSGPTIPAIDIIADVLGGGPSFEGKIWSGKAQGDLFHPGSTLLC